MNSKQSGKSAKYSFGLLETPSSTVSSTTVSNEGPGSNSSSPHEGNTSSTSAPHNSTCRTTGPRQNTTSSSDSVRRRFGTSSSLSSHLRTPARYSSGCVSSKSKTPGTFKTPRTPAARKTPKTPFGTATSVASTSESVGSVIVAIVEGRGLARGEIGMASIDLKCPVLTMSQFSDTQRYVKTLTKLQILKPLEILLPNTACENGNATKLFQMISDEFQHTTISTVQRRYFNETKGLQYINQLCLPDYRTVEMEVSAKYYCLATAAALLKYVEFIQNIMFAPTSLKIVFKGSEHTTMIDAVTARNLELLENQRDPKSAHTLYGVLNYTHTPGGARLLRSNILQPSSDLETITLRQDVVRELTEKEPVFYNLQGVLSKLLLDVDLLISHCVQIPRQDSVRVAETNINTVICLKHVLGLVPVLHEFLKDCENPLLKAYCKTLEDARFELIMSKINLVIHEDTMFQKGTLPMRTQKCFAVKPKVNGLLDVARRAYTEIVDDITAMIKQLGEQYSLPMKSAFSTVRGFYIQLYCGGKDAISAKQLPPVFVKVTKVKNTLNFITPDLIKLNDRVENSLDEIYLMTNIVMKELLMSVREFISVLYKFSEIVSTLDMLLSFAHACTLSSYVCPEFTDTLAIKQGRHPVLEKIGGGSPVPNNTYAAEDSNFVVITGPNMSGKSTYLRQVALLQIMAQIGSFVPAEYASFRLTSHIFSRVGSDDHMETNSSTFTLEMKEINYIIQNATNNSLIIIDELGRGTSAQEGVGICWAVCEYLLKTKSFTFFVTHFSELTNLDNLYANVENYFFEVHRSFSREGNCEKITYTHIMSRGKTEEKHYGLRLAEMSTLPREVLQDAQQLADNLNTLRQEKQAVDGEVCRQRAVFKLGTKLLQLARNSRLEEQSLRAYLSSLMAQQSPRITQRPSSTHLPDQGQPQHNDPQAQQSAVPRDWHSTAHAQNSTEQKDAESAGKEQENTAQHRTTLTQQGPQSSHKGVSESGQNAARAQQYQQFRQPTHPSLHSQCPSQEVSVQQTVSATKRPDGRPLQAENRESRTDEQSHSMPVYQQQRTLPTSVGDLTVQQEEHEEQTQGQNLRISWLQRQHTLSTKAAHQQSHNKQKQDPVKEQREERMSLKEDKQFRRPAFTLQDHSSHSSLLGSQSIVALSSQREVIVKAPSSQPVRDGTRTSNADCPLSGQSMQLIPAGSRSQQLETSSDPIRLPVSLSSYQETHGIPSQTGVSRERRDRDPNSQAKECPDSLMRSSQAQDSQAQSRCAQERPPLLDVSKRRGFCEAVTGRPAPVQKQLQQFIQQEQEQQQQLVEQSISAKIPRLSYGFSNSQQKQVSSV